MFARNVRGGGAGLLMVLAMVGVSGCGGSDGTSARDQAEAIREARADARREARAEAKAEKAADDAKALQKEVDALKKGTKTTAGSSSSGGGSSSGGAAAPASSGTTSCGGGLSVNSVTTCPFAENVRGEYGSNPGASEISAFSPATGKLITMRCSSGVTTICRGGNNAIVYIR